MKKHFNTKTFTFFTINFIVGLGFVATINEVLPLGLWGYLAITLSFFTVLGTSLVFSRLANVYNDHYGGSYAYAREISDEVSHPHIQYNIFAKKTLKQKFIEQFIFLVGWNQFMQSPILSSISPLLLSRVIEIIIPNNINNYEIIIWSIRIISILVFSILILLSTKGLKLSTKIVYITSSVKWIVLLIGIILIIYQLSLSQEYSENILKSQQLTPYLLINSITLFIYAFAGVEDMGAMVKDVKFKNFRVILLFSLGLIFGFYLLIYTLLLGIKTNPDEDFSQIYKITLGVFGIVLFLIGFISNDIGYKITQTISSARKIVPLSEDHFIHPIFSRKNKQNEYKNAIIFTALVTLFAMIVLWLIPTITGNRDYYLGVIVISSLALFLQDILTFITAFILEKKKKISKIPLYEKVIYSLNIIWMLFLILSISFPQILGQEWSSINIFIIIGFFGSILFGFLLKWISHLVLKKQIINKSNN
ncbi:amino acid permease [Mycoplasma leonicaptivi]|uniref:amino acid permease n=1 Tax=Mycoplasma leonicaptivi TaxID=36742 RepID=UPI0004808413|nr:APC family permease [Mycoplasma leonicaptivi]